MTFFSSLTNCWLGLCRKTPLLHTASAALLGDLGEIQSVRPDAGGAAGGPARIRRGISIATGSIRALFHDWRLMVFSLLAGLVLIFLIAAEGWNVSHYESIFATSLWIPFGDTTISIFDLRLFLIEAVCLSGFTLLLAALVRYRSVKKTSSTVTFREAFRGATEHAGTLAALSMVLALAATVLLELTAQNRVTGGIESALSMAMFWLPYAYYFSPSGIFTALFFSFRIMVANIVLLLLALYVVPVIVFEGKGLLPAFAGSIGLMRKTWRELLGCAIVFFAIVLFIAAIALLIGQSPALFNNDYDFFLQESRGLILMTGVCYGFLLACGVLMALGVTSLGIAITDLYRCGKKDGNLPGQVRDSTANAELLR